MMAMKRVGRPPAEDSTVAVTARLPGSMVAALDAMLEQRRVQDPKMTRQDMLREAVRRFVNAERRKAKEREA
jgi:hypothetical protein